jgi:hypothetical protein
MEHPIKTGTILIKDGALLPPDLGFETESYVPGWKLVKGLDGCGFDRAIRKTGWTFFCLSGEIQASAFGMENDKMVRKAIERILAKVTPDGFNSLEIMRVRPVHPGRFPLGRYVTVYAESRHIQESLFLVPAKPIAGSPPTNLTGEDPGPGRVRGGRRWWSGLAYGRSMP